MRLSARPSLPIQHELLNVHRGGEAERGYAGGRSRASVPSPAAAAAVVDDDDDDDGRNIDVPSLTMA